MERIILARRITALLLISSSIVILSNIPSTAGSNEQTYEGGTSRGVCSNALGDFGYFTKFYYKLRTAPNYPDIAFVNMLVTFDSTNTIQDSHYIIPPQPGEVGLIERPKVPSIIAVLKGKAYGLAIKNGRVVVAEYIIPALPVDCDPQPYSPPPVNPTPPPPPPGSGL